MLHYTEYNKVNNSEKIGELENQIEKLKMIGGVSKDLVFYLESLERTKSIPLVQRIDSHVRGGCFIILEDNSMDLLEPFKNIWNKQSDTTKEKVSISFSGSSTKMKGVSVYWRDEKNGWSTNDIADIVEEKVFS